MRGFDPQHITPSHLRHPSFRAQRSVLHCVLQTRNLCPPEKIPDQQCTTIGVLHRIRDDGWKSLKRDLIINGFVEAALGSCTTCLCHALGGWLGISAAAT
jgi:hypothetical protein